jgi:hypothetical protein
MATMIIEGKTVLNWAKLIPVAEWIYYREVLRSLQNRRIRLALGGGLAFSPGHFAPAVGRIIRNSKLEL